MWPWPWWPEWRVAEGGLSLVTSPLLLSAAGLWTGARRPWGSGHLSVGWLLLFKTDWLSSLSVWQHPKIGSLVQNPSESQLSYLQNGKKMHSLMWVTWKQSKITWLGTLSTVKHNVNVISYYYSSEEPILWNIYCYLKWIPLLAERKNRTDEFSLRPTVLQPPHLSKG